MKFILKNKAFFHETSHNTVLSVRQACAVESLAFHNPHLSIYVLMANEVNSSHPIIRALRTYGNINLLQIQLADYFSDTPLENWYFCNSWRSGKYSTSHLSDALRFLTLYKYGGYYFDLDFVMLRSVSDHRNFVGLESIKTLGSAAMHADFQHPIFNQTILEFRDTYNTNLWGHNGPLLITRVLNRSCSNLHNCTTFNVLPTEIFYPVSYQNWRTYFSTKLVSSFKWNKTVGVHLWNNLSKGEAVVKNSKQVYAQLAMKNCPRVFNVSGAKFWSSIAHYIM